MWLTQGVSEELFSGGGPTIVVSQIGGDVLKFLAITDPGAARRWKGEQALVDPANPVVAGRTQGFAVSVVGSAGASSTLRAITLKALAVHLTTLGAGEQGDMVIFGVPPSSVASCELLVSETDRVAVAQAVPVVLPPENGYSEQWALTNASDFQPPHAYFDSRASQWYWLAATMMILLLWGLYLRLRRSEIALYAVAGLSTGDLSVLLGTEFAIVILSAASLCTLATGVAFALHHFQMGDVSVGVIAGGRCLLASIFAAVAISVCVASGARTSTLEGLQDR